VKALVLDGDFEPRPGYPVTEWERETRTACQGSNVWRNTRLEVRDIPTPEVGPEDVLIQVAACGVCGSDLHLYETDEDGYQIYPSYTRRPVVIGHEFAGTVMEVGEQVTEVQLGDRVTAEQLHWCGKCFSCRRGLYNHCTNLGRLGFVTNGAFAEYVAVKEKYCWSLNDLIELYGPERVFEAGAVIEPTGIAYNGLFPRAGGFPPGAYVVVFGAGPIGLACIALARVAGAAKIIAFEMSAPRRKMALEMGADVGFDPAELAIQGSSPHQVILELTSGHGADLQVEATGVAAITIPEMEQALAVDGKIVHLGRRAEIVPSNMTLYQNRGAQLYGSLGHTGWGTFGHIIRLMASGRIDMTPMITTRYPLERAVEAIESLRDRQGGKVMVKIHEGAHG
jgi:threonine dehydrogenase-like Zn-dependent dehydrogenase